MDKIKREDISPQTEGELASPLSPKRPRMDYTVANIHCGKRRFDFPELLTFEKTIGSQLSRNTPKENVVLMCAAESEYIDEKPHGQPQDTKLIVTPITMATASHTDNAYTVLSDVCLTTANRNLLHLGKDEQPPLTETEKLSSYPIHDVDGALAEPHNLKDGSADTSSHPNCKWPGKSLEDKPPGSCCLSAGNEGNGRQVQNNVSQFQPFTLSSSDEEIKYQSVCIYEEALHDAVFCNIWSQSVEAKTSNWKKKKLGFSENILFSKEEEDVNSHIPGSDYTDSASLYSNLEKDPSGNLAEGVKSEEKISELLISEKENVTVCDGERKVQVIENGMSKTSIQSVAEYAEGLLVSYDVVLARNIATENVGVEVNDFCVATGEHAAGEMIAKAWNMMADHTTETQMAARISQKPTEGDNDPDPFRVIDPATWCKTDREVEEEHCKRESIAGVELFPSVKICETKITLPLFSDVKPSHEVSVPGQTRKFNHHSTTWHSKDEKEDLCQSYAELQACCMLIKETHDLTGNESISHWKSSPNSRPTKPPPTGDGRHENHSSVRHQWNKQAQSNSFPVSFDHLKTQAQKVDYSQTKFARIERTTEAKEREDIRSTVEQIKTDGHWSLEKAMESEEELLQQNEKHKKNTNEISNGDCSDWTEGEISECENILTFIKGEKKSEEKGGKEVTNVGEEIQKDGQENSKVLVKKEDDLRKHNENRTDTTEMCFIHVECISEWTEGNTRKTGNKLSQDSRHQQGNKLSHFPDSQDRTPTLMFENKYALLVSLFSPTHDAVVPCQHDLIPSQNANNNPTALNCDCRFSLVPSAFSFYEWVRGGFDAFQNIQLSPDEDDDDARLDNSLLLTSMPRQLLKTSEQQNSYSITGAKSDRHKEIPGAMEEEGKEEVERFECHIEKMAKEFLSCDSSCKDLLNFISEADIVAEHIHDELKPQSVSSTVSTENDSPSDVHNYPEFEMKKIFDTVLKELNLYFDISIKDFASKSKASSSEQCSDSTEALAGYALNCKEHLSSPELGCHQDTSSTSSLEICNGDPVVSCTTGSCDGEKDVPLDSHMCQETSMNAVAKQREHQEREKRRKIWSPSFEYPPFLQQPSVRTPELPRRLEPLRTCTRPIRVGLSKRAKTKHLHCPHSYK